MIELKREKVRNELRAFAEKHGMMPDDPSKVDEWYKQTEELSPECRALLPDRALAEQYAEKMYALREMITSDPYRSGWGPSDSILILLTQLIVQAVAAGRWGTDTVAADVLKELNNETQWSTFQQMLLSTSRAVAAAVQEGKTDELRKAVRDTFRVLSGDEQDESPALSLAGPVVLVLVFKYIPETIRDEIMQKNVGTAVKEMSAVIVDFMRRHVEGGAEKHRDFTTLAIQTGALALLAVLDEELDMYIDTVKLAMKMQESPMPEAEA